MTVAPAPIPAGTYAGRIVRIEPLNDLPGCTDAYARIYFEDGRWLEVQGASRGWPEGL